MASHKILLFFSGLKSLKQQRTIKAHSKILLPSAGLVSTESHTALAETALNHMNNDEVTNTVKRDTVIKQLGSILLGKLGTQRKSDVSKRILQLDIYQVPVAHQADSDAPTPSKNTCVPGTGKTLAGESLGSYNDTISTNGKEKELHM